MEIVTAKAAAYLKKGEGRALKGGSAWIYDNEIDRIEGNFENGDIIQAVDFDGYPLGFGLINTHSTIRIRMLSRYRKEPIDTAFLQDRVHAACEYRRTILSPQDFSACRLIFGEADFLPGLTVDKYEDLLVVESLSLGMDRLKKLVLELLIRELAESSCPVRAIFERSDAPVRKKEGMQPFKGLIYLNGSWEISPETDRNFDPHVEIKENGVRYLVNVRNGQKTGFFLDQKFNRLAIQKIAAEKKVLDCFTHMGTFALNAGLAGASEVTGLDISDFAIAQAEHNAVLNGLDKNVHFRTANVLDELPRLYEQGQKYDLVILDPPAFTKSREATKNAIKGYREINMKGLRLVRDGGYLATCSCSHFMTQELLAKTIAEAARSVHKRLRQVEFRTQAPDHPILWASDESYYLKFYIFQVVEEK